MKRNPRKMRWTKAFRKAAGKEMTIDSTFEFEKRRNVPVRYDRDLMQKTVQAMKRIEEIRRKREKAFYVQRIEKGRVVERAEMVKEVAKSADLLQESTGAVKIAEKRKLSAEKQKIKQKILASMARNKMETDWILIINFPITL